MSGVVGQRAGQRFEGLVAADHFGWDQPVHPVGRELPGADEVGELGAPTQVEFAVDVAEVKLDGLDADAEHASGRLVGCALADSDRDATLLLRQSGAAAHG